MSELSKVVLGSVEPMRRAPAPVSVKVGGFDSEHHYSDDELWQVRENLRQWREAISGARSDNTIKQQASTLKVFSSWCESNGKIAIPPTPTTLVEFIEDQAKTKKPATVKSYLSILSAILGDGARLVNNPCSDSRVRLALQRCKRSDKKGERQAAPLTHTVISRIKHEIESTGSLRDKQDLALVLMAYSTFCRQSELVAMRVQDITYDTDGSALAYIARSKTDQHGEGEFRYVRPEAAKALKEWLAVADIQEGLIFRPVLGKYTVKPEPMHSDRVSMTFKRLVKRIGLDDKQFSGHSARVGAAQDAAQAGCDVLELMRAGGWKSSGMPARYSRKADAKKSAAAKMAVHSSFF